MRSVFEHVWPLIVINEGTGNVRRDVLRFTIRPTATGAHPLHTFYTQPVEYIYEVYGSLASSLAAATVVMCSFITHFILSAPRQLASYSP